MNTTPRTAITNTIVPNDDDLAELLAAWRTHQDNRAKGASVAELFATRSELDATREAVQSNLALAS